MEALRGRSEVNVLFVFCCYCCCCCCFFFHFVVVIVCGGHHKIKMIDFLFSCRSPYQIELEKNPEKLSSVLEHILIAIKVISVYNIQILEYQIGNV